MVSDKSLFLHEEIVLLALRDKAGTFEAGNIEHLIAGAVLADLLLAQRIMVDGARRQLVTVQNGSPLGDRVIDLCLEKMASRKRRTTLKSWVSRLAGLKDLKHAVAKQLCDKGVLQADEDKVLFIFNRRIYPEINPMPEEQIIGRLERAIYTDQREIEPRTVVLVSLANAADLLSKNLGRSQIKPYKKRIKQISNGDLVGSATKEVIAACQAAVMVAVIVPLMVSNTLHT